MPDHDYTPDAERDDPVWDPKRSVNPPHNLPARKPYEELKAWLRRYHKAADSMEAWYELYPYERLHEPVPPRDPDRGRGGR